MFTLKHVRCETSQGLSVETKVITLHLTKLSWMQSRMASGGLGSVGDDLFERLTKTLTTDEVELKEYAKEEEKPMIELDQSKCDRGWCLFPSSSDLSTLAFGCR